MRQRNQGLLMVKRALWKEASSEGQAAPTEQQSEAEAAEPGSATR